MTDRSPEFHGYSRHTCLTHPSDMQSSEYNSLQQLHSLPFFLWTLSSAVVSLFHSCVSASCINNRRYMPISLLTPLCSITVPFDADAVQERDSSVEPQGSLPVFEIVFQTFCLVLWQDTSLLLTALLQAKKKASVTSSIFSFLLRSLYHFTASLPLWHRGLGRSQRSRGGCGGRAASSVLSGPTVSKLTYAAQINCTFLKPPTPF